jgi:hypothetical protein
MGPGILVVSINVELYNLGKNILVALTETGLNFDEFKLAGLHEKQAASTWHLVTISGLA